MEEFESFKLIKLELNLTNFPLSGFRRIYREEKCHYDLWFSKVQIQVTFLISGNVLPGSSNNVYRECGFRGQGGRAGRKCLTVFAFPFLLFLLCQIQLC